MQRRNFGIPVSKSLERFLSPSLSLVPSVWAGEWSFHKPGGSGGRGRKLDVRLTEQGGSAGDDGNVTLLKALAAQPETGRRPPHIKLGASPVLQPRAPGPSLSSPLPESSFLSFPVPPPLLCGSLSPPSCPWVPICFDLPALLFQTGTLVGLRLLGALAPSPASAPRLAGLLLSPSGISLASQYTG